MDDIDVYKDDIDDPEELRRQHESKLADLKKMELDEVLRYLGVNDREGLSSKEAARRLQIHGPNILLRPKEVCFSAGWDAHKEVLKLFVLEVGPLLPEPKIMMRLMLNPVSWAVVLAAAIAVTCARVHGETLFAWEARATLLLLLFNIAACLVAMAGAHYARTPLLGALAPKAKVLRDGVWREENPANLVPGDIIFLKGGDIVPANARVLRINELMTKSQFGRSCSEGSMIYYQGTCEHGEGIAVVVATGRDIVAEKSVLDSSWCGYPGQLRKGVLAAGSFCCVSILLGMMVELIFTGARGHGFRNLMHDHFILLTGATPIAMPAVFYLALAIGSRKLSQLGAVSRGTRAVEDLAAVDTIYLNVTGTLTLNQPIFDEDKIEVCAEGVDKEQVILLAARTSSTHRHLFQEPIDAAIINMLADPEEARAGIEEEEYMPFYYITRYSSVRYADEKGRGHCSRKGDPDRLIKFCQCTEEVRARVLRMTDEVARDGYQVLAVAQKEGPDKHWQLVGLMPFRDSLRPGCVEAIDSLIEMGLRVVVLTGGQLSITKELCKRLGKLGSNVTSWRQTSLKYEAMLNCNGLADVHPEEKGAIVRDTWEYCQRRCMMVGGGMYDCEALRLSDMSISVADACDRAKSFSNLVLTKPGLSSIVCAVRISRVTSQRMKSYIIYAVSATIHITIGVVLISLIWKLSFSPFLISVMATINYGTALAILFDRVKLSLSPNKWRVKVMVATGVAYGIYIALTTVIFFWVLRDTGFLVNKFEVRSLRDNDNEIRAALFLQMSIVNQAVMFLARSSKNCFIDCPGLLVVCFFTVAQMVATLVAVYLEGVSWGWAGIIWLYDALALLVLVFIKFITYRLGAKVWKFLLEKALSKPSEDSPPSNST